MTTAMFLILVVEDDAELRGVLRTMLESNQYRVVDAATGERGLIEARSHRPDLLISDVMMPLMDGPTMVRRARARYPDLPILFMSGYAEEQLRRSIDLDRMGFLPKPFSVKALAEAVQLALSTD